MATPPLRQLPRGKLCQFLDSKSGQFLEKLGQILGTKMRPALQKTCIKSKKNHKFLNGLGLVFYARNWSQKLVHKTNLYLFFNYVAIFWHQKLGQKAARKLVHFWKPLEQGLMVFLYQCPWRAPSKCWQCCANGDAASQRQRQAPH